MHEILRFAEGFQLAECPRWHAGRLWLSDMWGRAVWRFDRDGGRQAIARFDDDDPGGLGWLPDGRLLVVGMERRVVYRLEVGGPVVHADLSGHAAWPCNDMIVADDGTAYVSHFGFDLWGGTTGFQPTSLLRVTPDGRVDAVADGMLCPNGMALSADGRMLVVAEPGGGRLTRFGVAADGSLRERSVFAELVPAPGQQHAPPDGICLDAEGAVWAAEPLGRRVLRIEPGGRVSVEIPCELHPLAVALGGPDRRTLFVCLAGEISRPRRSGAANARVDALRVDVPGEGRP
jgi:sugar lactone lactonase YvrE